MTTKREGENVEGENPNKKAMTADAKPMERVLIFGGKTGWIGQMMAELVKKEGMDGIALHVGFGLTEFNRNGCCLNSILTLFWRILQITSNSLLLTQGSKIAKMLPRNSTK